MKASRSIVVSCFAGWHGFDLAQGLDRAGLLQCLVTLANPRQIEANYGIPRHRIRRLPFAGLLHRTELWLSTNASAGINDLYYGFFCWLYDCFTQIFLGPHTRMLIAWHPFATKALVKARQQGIVTVLDVGSTHPRYQYATLCREHQVLGLRRPWVPRRALDQTWIFDVVDQICIPSTPVLQSFLAEGVSRDRLFLNPYGVNSEVFCRPRQTLSRGPFSHSYPLRVLTVASLTPRKGSRLLLDICRHFQGDQRIAFTLVGSIDPPYTARNTDLPDNLLIQPPVCHAELVQIYHQNHVFLLPSLEEGFARVLIEAAGCGLTLLATPPTGLADLLQHAPDAGFLLKDHELCTAVEALRSLIVGDLPLSGASQQQLSFYLRSAYQDRSASFLESYLSVGR